MDPNSPEALFEAVRESGLYPPERLAALPKIAEICGGDFALLADQLLAHALVTNYQFRKIRLNRIHELFVGQYLVLDKLGEGGMGKVYKAVQVRMGRLVALKVVRPQHLTNKVVMRRFKREAAAAAALNHPNIVTLYDADESGGKYFLAMEYVDGSDLSRLVKEFGKLPYAEAAEYMRQAALGLQHAHDNGFIHRDIKPANLLVCGERALPGTGGRALLKVLDMGLVRSLADDEDASRTELTRDGTVVGTPDYMAPEQAKNSSTVDHRADLYSLGCTFFMLLTGRPPFPDGTPIDKLLRHQLDPPPDILRHRPDLPFGLAGIVNKLLAKKADDRYPTAARVAEELAPFTSDATPAAAPVEPAAPPRAKAARPRRPVPDGKTLVTTLPEVPAAAPARPRPAVPARKAAPVVIPKPAAAAETSSESLPTTDATKTTAATRVTKIRKPLKTIPDASGLKKGLVGGAVAAGVLVLLGGAAVVLFKNTGDKNAPVASAKDPDPVPPGPPIPGVPAVPHAVPLPPAAVNLPDGTVACLVVHPRAFWKRAAYDIKPESRFAGYLTAWTTKYQFDPRKFDRATVAFVGKPGEFVAVGEGAFARAGFADKLDKAPGATAEAPGPPKLYKFPRGADGPLFAAVLADRGYAVGNTRGGLDGVAARAAARKPPAGVPSALTEALPDPADPDAPVVTFVATGGFKVPQLDTLAASHISLMVVAVRLRDDAFDIDVQLVGRSKDDLVTFVSTGIPLKFEAAFPDFKPFITAVTAGDDRYRYEAEGNRTRMRLSGKWDVVQFHDWLEAALAGFK